MNRYTTEDIEELGNIAAEICCEKKFNPFTFKKFAKKGDKKDEDDDGSKEKPKFKSKGKKAKNEKVDEGYLVEFEENQGIPWEPINEGSGVWSDFDNYDGEDSGGSRVEEDPNYEDDPFMPETPVKKRRSPGEVEMVDDDEGEIGEDDADIDPEEKIPGVKSDRDLETEDDFEYDANADDAETLKKFAYNPFNKKDNEPSLDTAMDAAENDETPASDDLQADEIGEGAPTGTVHYPVNLKFADGFEEDYNEDEFSFDDIVKNLTTEHSGVDDDSRIIEINGVDADEWAAQHGINNVVPPDEHEETDSDLDDTEIEDMESEPEEISRDKFREIDLDNFDF